MLKLTMTRFVPAPLALAGLSVVAIAILVAFSGLVAPNRLVPPLTDAELEAAGIDDPQDRFRLIEMRSARREDVRSELLTMTMQALGGTAIIAGAITTWRTLQLNRLKEQSEQFARTAGLLGHDALDVRIGGMYALKRMVDQDLVAPDTVAAILSAYVRRRSPSQDADGADSPVKAEPLCVSFPDTQTAMEVLTSIPRGDAPLILQGAQLARADLHDADLHKADLSDANLCGADLTGANLEGALLHNACLSPAQPRWGDPIRTNLKDARLANANLIETNFEGALLRGANLTSADLTGATLEGADLSSACLERATLKGAVFKGEANLSDAKLVDVNIAGADFTGTTLDRVKLTADTTKGQDTTVFCDSSLKDAYLAGNLSLADFTGANLGGAKADSKTRWPDELKEPKERDRAGISIV